MSNAASLEFPNKSHRKQVAIPSYSSELAEFFGIMMGDGGINNKWQANITLNSVADAEYINYVKVLISNLFSIAPKTLIYKKGNATRIVISSTSIVDFLVENGLPRGNKLKNGLIIPNWILNNQDYLISCIRGLVDTDGCLYIHKHSINQKKYENIGFCFCSYSKELICQVADAFEVFGILPHISNQGRSIYLYKVDSIARYMKIFGTSNERISSVYKNWKRG